MMAPNVLAEAPTNTPLPRWITMVGWACVAGCTVFATAVACDILELPDWDIGSGFIDYFIPGPRAMGMLLWELSHIWVLLVGLQLFRLRRQSHNVRTRDLLLAATLFVGVVAGRLLLAALARRGVQLGIPGFDH